MKLFELFSKPVTTGDPDSGIQPYNSFTEDGKKRIINDVYYFIIDNTRLHKKYFFPIARQIKTLIKNNEYNEQAHCKKWMLMVNAGCLDFYKIYNLKGDPKDIFKYENRLELVNKLAKEYYNDISKDIYKLGD